MFLDDDSGSYDYDANPLVLPSVTSSTSDECVISIGSISSSSLLDSPSPFYQGIYTKSFKLPTEITISCVDLSSSLSCSSFLPPERYLCDIVILHLDYSYSKSCIK